jgi:hypothetical protein
MVSSFFNKMFPVRAIWHSVITILLRLWRRLPFLKDKPRQTENLPLIYDTLLSSNRPDSPERDTTTSNRPHTPDTIIFEYGTSEEPPKWDPAWDEVDEDDIIWVKSSEEGPKAYGPGGFTPSSSATSTTTGTRFSANLAMACYQRSGLSEISRAGKFEVAPFHRQLDNRMMLTTPSPDNKTPYRAMKCLIAEAYNHPQGEKDIFELEILKHLRDANPGTAGHDCINHLLDDFVHEGPNGKHVCLVFEPMGETLHTFNSWFEEYNKLLPGVVMERFAIQLIAAIMYAHRNGVIHTGKLLLATYIKGLY